VAKSRKAEIKRKMRRVYGSYNGTPDVNTAIDSVGGFELARVMREPNRLMEYLQ
jgi:hypothetical protein